MLWNRSRIILQYKKSKQEDLENKKTAALVNGLCKAERVQLDKRRFI